MNVRDCRLNLEAIFKSIKDAIITVDEECSVLELNQAAKNICHYSQDDIGQDFRTLSEGRGGKCVEAIVKTIEKRKPMLNASATRPARRGAVLLWSRSYKNLLEVIDRACMMC